MGFDIITIFNLGDENENDFKNKDEWLSPDLVISFPLSGVLGIELS